jgi:DNA-binding transcriptional ArsR family regulator
MEKASTQIKTVFYNIRNCRQTRDVSGITFRGRHGMHTAINELIGKQEHIETAARALKAISHPLRLKILCVVGDQETCVQDIVEAVGTSQSNISQHLEILRDKGVLQTRKDANRVFYRIADQRTLQLIALMREVFCAAPAHRD